MATETVQADVNEGPVIADGVDEEPVENNRRLFEGRALLLVAGLSAFYAIFHMAALNGWSIKGWTGVDIPGLPQFPMETWNFRIVHVAGALGLGFILYSARAFVDDTGGRQQRGPISVAAALLFLPLLVAAWTAMGFVTFLGSDDVIELGGRVVWVSMAETPEAFASYAEIYSKEVYWFGLPLLAATFGAIVIGWFETRIRSSIAVSDIVLALCGVVAAAYLVTVYATAARNAVGTPNVPIGIAFAATAATALILELTRRVAGLALVVITGVFLVYTFTAHLLPGILAVQNAYTWQRFFGFVYTDAGILGPTTAVSSTYIILFIIFAAFLQASKVGDYFVNFAFACAGRSRGGPAKVAIFASGLMGMINGTSAGNVVATGSLTIPLMKKVGYKPQTAGAIEAAASTGGQIMPPIMGAGAFIMAEITGIPYQDIAIAAIIPAVLYFVSIYFMVDFEAAKLGMRGMREDELPKFRDMVKRVFLFLPIIILIGALFMGYSVIRAGTLATAAAVVVSWARPDHFGIGERVGWGVQRLLVVAITVLTVVMAALYFGGSYAAVDVPAEWTQSAAATLLAVVIATFLYVTFREVAGGESEGLGLNRTVKAFEMAGYMSIQIIAVCACAGIVVAVISLTGVGQRFSSVLLTIAEGLGNTEFIVSVFGTEAAEGFGALMAMFFAMCIAILLGMGMPTTAAYAVAASVVAPGLVQQLGIPPLTAHFFVFYFAVVSAITPPVALASYAAAGISGANPMATSMASFKIGIAAFIVPFMFFYNSAILMDGTWFEVGRAAVTAIFGVFMLSSGVQGWWVGAKAPGYIRVALILVALFMIEGGWLSDLVGVGGALALFLLARATGSRAAA